MLTALAKHRCFIIYRARDKSPIDPLHEFPNTDWANSNAQDRTTWLLPHEAEAYAAMLGAGYGVGIVLHPELKIFCVDIDGALVDDQWSALALAFFTRFAGCAIEVSMSGRGAHIFGRYSGDMPPHKSKNTALHIEFYHELRYIALTGTNLVGDITHDATALIPPFIAQYFTQGDEDGNPADWREGPVPGYAGPTDDAVLIERALKSKSMAAVFGGGVSFADLWTGNTAKLGNKWPSSTGGSYDESSADQALANHLAFWSGADCNRMLRLMGESALKRDKWETRPDYLPRTILRACSWQKTFAGPTGAAKAVAAPALTHILHAPPAPQTAPPPPALIAPPPPAADGTAAFTVPAIPDSVQHAPPPWDGTGAPPIPATVQHAPVAKGMGELVGAQGQEELFEGCVYVQDILAIMSPGGICLDRQRFENNAKFSGRTYITTRDGTKPQQSAWMAFTQSEHTKFPKVHGLYFEPREAPGAIIERDGLDHVNSWIPLNIPSVPGDVSRFLTHLAKLLPTGNDAHILLQFLKFMVQFKGRKAAWCPFIQGVEGNGKSFISATMQYCLGERYTHKPKAAELDGRFNSVFYGKLFIAVDDVKISEDRGSMWETLKPMIDGTRLEIEAKGVNKVTREVCFNFILNSNHKDGIRKTANDRRIAPFFCAQQSEADLARDGLTVDYFTDLWAWAQNGGWASVLNYLETDPIDDVYNPAGKAIRAPVTSSTSAAIEAGMGSVEQDVLEATVIDLYGFAGGWVSGAALDALLDGKGKGKFLSRSKRREVMAAIGYIPHPGLPDGRVTSKLTDGTKPRLYVRKDHTTIVMADPAMIKAAYEAAQKPT